MATSSAAWRSSIRFSMATSSADHSSVGGGGGDGGDGEGGGGGGGGGGGDGLEAKSTGNHCGGTARLSE